ncbi:hypothetical protein EZV62_009341 [Acer yangbiense]|uniref:Uncharacterized protein n=1 Tax=Acer yangbiense TaxID=1000413 RepID=A0A5C7IHW0_9ROSI|nr:hypothetical protein EZV62_009341 [Acer yangbiense]
MKDCGSSTMLERKSERTLESLILTKTLSVLSLMLLGRVYNILRENNPELAEDRRRTVMRPSHVLHEGTKKTVFVNFMDLCKTYVPVLTLLFFCNEMLVLFITARSKDGKEFDQYGDDQLWKILDDYWLCFEGNAKESEEVAPLNTNVDQPSCETDNEKELEELLMAVDQPSFETDDEKELEELLMADHNEPRPLHCFLEKLQKKANVKKIALMEDLFLDDFYEPRPLHVFLDQLCTLSQQ